jgi:hypothetical protein
MLPNVAWNVEVDGAGGSDILDVEEEGFVLTSLCNATAVFFARIGDELKGTQRGDYRAAEETYAVSWARASTVQSDRF